MINSPSASHKNNSLTQSIDTETVLVIDDRDEESQEPEAPPVNDAENEALAKKRKYDRERQKICHDKRHAKMRDGAIQSNALLKENSDRANQVISLTDKKDKAYQEYVKLLGDAQSFAQTSNGNKAKLCSLLSNMECAITPAERESILERVKNPPITSQFANAQATNKILRESTSNQVNESARSSLSKSK